MSIKPRCSITLEVFYKNDNCKVHIRRLVFPKLIKTSFVERKLVYEYAINLGFTREKAH